MMAKQSINRKLREELSPVRSASPTSSTSSRDHARSHRHRSRSPYSRSEGRPRNRDHRSDYGSYNGYSSRGYYEGRHHDSTRGRDRSYDDDSKRKRNSTSPPKESSVKRPKNDTPANPSGARLNGAENGKSQASGKGFHMSMGSKGKQGSSVKPFFSQGKHEAQNDTAFEGEAKSSNLPVGTKRSEYQSEVKQSAEDSREANTASARDDANDATGTNKLPRDNGTMKPVLEEIEQAPVEESTAEERRKRREAIRAKHRNQSSDLRIQAAQQNMGSTVGKDVPQTQPDLSSEGTSRPNTPNTPAIGLSPPSASPNSPAEGQSLGSPEPIAVVNDAELANSKTESATLDQPEGPSAADYDPTDDMREDQVRHQKRLDSDLLPSQAHEENQLQEHQVPIPGEGVEKPSDVEASKTKAEADKDDMFASDDDDMFTTTPTDKPFNVNSQASKPSNKSINTSMLDNWDDPDGYYQPILGETIDGRYQIQHNLGKGMFSGVVRALDLQSKQEKAIKIIRNNESMVKAAHKEMAILQKLADADPADKKHLVRLERSFTHRDHLCLVFENLSLNLREVLKKCGRDVGINIKAIRSYAQQMFLALGLMRKSNIFHADLKPDNILVTEDRATLKVCDLGSAGDTSEFEIAPYLVSRYYRAPEIILGCRYDFAIDMWSIGCTLFELFTGKILFTGRDNNGMLRSIMETRGKISVKMLKKAEFGGDYFDDQSLLFKSVEKDRITNRTQVKLLNFQKPTQDLKDRVMAASPKHMTDAERKEMLMFVDLLDKCLLLNPERRITPVEALKHPFIHRGMAGPGGKQQRA